METLTLDEMIANDDTLAQFRQDAFTACGPQVYVACLASYNAGVLHGAWIPATDEDEMRDAIAAMLRQSPYPNVTVPCPDFILYQDRGTCPTCGGVGAHGKVRSAEEYAIHDYDGFGELAGQLGEYPSLETVAMHARMIDTHGNAWFAYCDWQDTAYQSEDDFEERYQGCHYSPEDFARQYVEDTAAGELERAPFISQYIDYQAIARDLQFGGDYHYEERGYNECYVFHAQ